MIEIQICMRMWYSDCWYNVWWCNIWRSTSCEHAWDGLYKCDGLSEDDKSGYVWKCCIGIDDIMCDDITYEDLHLASMPRMDYITCGDRNYDDLNPDVC